MDNNRNSHKAAGGRLAFLKQRYFLAFELHARWTCITSSIHVNYTRCACDLHVRCTWRKLHARCDEIHAKFTKWKTRRVLNHFSLITGPKLCTNWASDQNVLSRAFDQHVERGSRLDCSRSGMTTVGSDDLPVMCMYVSLNVNLKLNIYVGGITISWFNRVYQTFWTASHHRVTFWHCTRAW